MAAGPDRQGDLMDHGRLDPLLAGRGGDQLAQHGEGAVAGFGHVGLAHQRGVEHQLVKRRLGPGEIEIGQGRGADRRRPALGRGLAQAGLQLAEPHRRQPGQQRGLRGVVVIDRPGCDASAPGQRPQVHFRAAAALQQRARLVQQQGAQVADMVRASAGALVGPGHRAAPAAPYSIQCAQAQRGMASSLIGPMFSSRLQLVETGVRPSASTGRVKVSVDNPAARR